MSDLNARLIVKASATAGEAPQAADLEVAEIAVNTADAKLFTKHSDGSVVELTSASGGGGGSSVSDLADLDDVENVTPSTGELLYSDNGEYKHKPISEILAGRSLYTPGVTSTVTSDTGMAGINGFYVDDTAMVADGFTAFGGNNQDDQVLQIPDAAFADYAQVDYLAQGFSNLLKIRVNSNGSVYLNQTEVNITSRGGNYVTGHSSVSLVVSWLSEDTATRRSGYKEITQDGTDWFVVRVDMKVLFANADGGYPLETWFGKDGRIRQYFGSKVATGDFITLGNTRQGVATLGTNLTNVSGLNAAGGQRVEYLFDGVPALGWAGAKLEDLSDVGTPADDQFLVYDAASSSWVPESVPPAAPVDSVNGETGVVSLGIEDMNDFELSTPLTEGDILQWDDTDNKFKPAQLPAEPVDANSHTLPQLFGIGAHASFDASSGGSFDFATDTIASGNVSNITRTATGKFTIEFDNDFASNAYTAVCTAGDEDYSGNNASPRCVNVVSRSAGSMNIVVERSDDAVQDDEGYIAVMVIGLLA